MAEEFNASPLAWLKRVLETQDDEISCTECQDLVSEYVNIELETGNAAAQIPQLAYHLDQCPACWESYQVLRKLAQLEAHGGLPEVEELAERLKKDK